MQFAIDAFLDSYEPLEWDVLKWTALLYAVLLFLMLLPGAAGRLGFWLFSLTYALPVTLAVFLIAMLSVRLSQLGIWSVLTKAGRKVDGRPVLLSSDPETARIQTLFTAYIFIFLLGLLAFRVHYALWDREQLHKKHARYAAEAQRILDAQQKNAET